MKKSNIKNVLYFVPVRESYFSKWEYYKVDQKMLSDAHENV